MRLEQLNGAEIQVIKEFHLERQSIFKRLRELDETNSDFVIKLEDLTKEKEAAKEETKTEDSQLRERKLRIGRPSRRSKSSKMREAAIRILKEHREPLKGSQLQKMIEETTGLKIANMTTFMKTVEKADANIQKPYRGLYQYMAQR
ncbi:competence protein ComK [Heyndrickxia acidicola]|uniref:Competence protein ComK n=1 Tax=Heyndrickxia acidicola TaxID=209389 RepID=A0ABU6MA45_9BACI|nr:competence protein ComK [Heyndrickxia acidicola]MED1201551.1 competence protein ComK [Heyndrickxia acidicola]